MGFDDYKVLLYRNQPDGWVAEVPAIPGCHALMATREEALAELADVFRMISAEYLERGEALPADTTEVVMDCPIPDIRTIDPETLLDVSTDGKQF